MKLRKALMLAMMTTAIASVNLFAAYADVVPVEEVEATEADPADSPAAADQENLKNGWVEEREGWRYYDANGNLVNGWIAAEGGDGRGNEVWYYVDPATNVMIANTTRVINDVSYTFGEDGSWVAPYVGVPKGTKSGGSFVNTWSNIKVPQIIGSSDAEEDSEDRYTDAVYASIGSPKMTLDLNMSTEFGELEIFYLEMKKKPEMDAATFAAEFANVTKSKYATASAVETVTVGGQQYSKVTITKPGTRKATVTTYYCRKQGEYMVVISTSGFDSDAAAMADIVNTFTTAQ